MFKFLQATIYFGVFAVMGFFIAFKSWDGETFVALGNLNQNSLRNPAAVKKVFDFSQFEGSVFTSSSKKRLIQEAKIEKQAGRFGVELGHFVARMQDGDKLLACQAYDKVVLVFEAEGMAVNGEIPLMEVEGSCNILDDVNKMSAIWVPVDQIVATQPGETEFNFDEEKITVKFTHVMDTWPKKWLIKRVGLYDSSRAREAMEVGSLDITDVDFKQLKIDWDTL